MLVEKIRPFMHPSMTRKLPVFEIVEAMMVSPDGLRCPDRKSYRLNTLAAYHAMLPAVKRRPAFSAHFLTKSIRGRHANGSLVDRPPAW